ncbi:INO80 complex subunit C isoform X3 [Rhinoraja longicauda]
MAAASCSSSSSSSSPVPVAASTPSKNIVLDTIGENKNVAADSSPGHGEPAVKPLIFKDPNFVHSGIGGASAGKKNRVWKNLKQILATERMLPWKLNDPNYCNIDALPSFKPAKKYSDISGLPIVSPVALQLNIMELAALLVTDFEPYCRAMDLPSEPAISCSGSMLQLRPADFNIEELAVSGRG